MGSDLINGTISTFRDLDYYLRNRRDDHLLAISKNCTIDN